MTAIRSIMMEIYTGFVPGLTTSDVFIFLIHFSIIKPANKLDIQLALLYHGQTDVLPVTVQPL